MVAVPSLVLCALALAAPVAPKGESSPRSAIVVGANAAALGRAALRHSHRDLEAMAEVLRTVGRFDERDVHLLRDPAPDDVIRLVEREAAALAGKPQAMLFFYFSGHADRDALYSGGRPLALDRLRRALDRTDVALRIGMIDACQGGSWTRAKGLFPDAPFAVSVPAVLESEGSALIASSSGLESAHESDQLQASFFTYHFAAALRGAGDQSQDGTVTLNEAFEYARERTIRDSARVSPEPQHPSFALNVRGRQDIVLAHVADSPSVLAVDQREGPLELIHLSSGLRVLELPPGRRSVTLAVPPGKYLVRKVAASGIRTQEIAVPRDGSAEVAEEELVLLGNGRMAVKGESGAVGALPARGGWDVELGFQADREPVRHDYLAFGAGDPVSQNPVLRLDARLGFTDRLAWKVGTLALAYAFGEPGGIEVVPFGGLLSWRKLIEAGELDASLGAGVGARFPVVYGAVVLTASVERPIAEIYGGGGPLADYVARGALGYTARLGRIATLHAAAGLSSASYPARTMDDPWGTEQRFSARRVVSWWVGSVQELGLASLPLLALHAPQGWSLNLYAALSNVDYGYAHLMTRLGIAKAL